MLATHVTFNHARIKFHGISLSWPKRSNCLRVLAHYGAREKEKVREASLNRWLGRIKVSLRNFTTLAMFLEPSQNRTPFRWPASQRNNFHLSRG